MKAVFYWLSERLRDAWLWPFNLVRDFPARSGRLARTLWVGAKAICTLPTLLWQFKDGKLSAKQKRPFLQQAGAWLHLLLAQLFDLVGGPEICQFVMHLGMHTTPLTPPEIAEAEAVFGSGNLRYKDVRIAEGGILNFIFRHNGGLAFATWYTVHLPRLREQEKSGGETAVSSRQNLPLLIHELTHIFQYQHVGSRYLGEAIYFLVTTHRDCYEYGGHQGLHACWQQGKPFSHFNREQQAQIIQDYYSCQQAGRDTKPFLPYLAQLQHRQL